MPVNISGWAMVTIAVADAKDVSRLSNGIACVDDMVDGGVADANDWHGNQGSRVS